MRTRFSLLIYRKTNFSIIFAVKGPRQGSLCLSSISVCTFLSQFCHVNMKNCFILNFCHSVLVTDMVENRWNFRIFLCILVERVIVNKYLWIDMWLCGFFNVFFGKGSSSRYVWTRVHFYMYGKSLQLTSDPASLTPCTEPKMFYFVSLP